MSIDTYGPAQAEAPRAEAVEHARLDQVIRAQTPALIRFLTRRTRNIEEAQDLAQEAFLRLTRATRRKIIDNPEGYLTLIARNLLRDRAKSVSGGIERRHAVLQPDLHVAHDGDPHLELAAKQTLARHEAAVMALKPKTREIYLLHRLDEKTYGQIAAIMGLSKSGVEKQMMTAIAHIDRALSRP